VDILDRIAERKLAEAVARGLLDDYPGKGEPLELEDLSGVPDDVRAGYVLLKGHGFLPEELCLRKELVDLDALLAACTDDGARERLRSSRTSAAVRLALLLERRGVSLAFHEYAERVVERLAGETRA